MNARILLVATLASCAMAKNSDERSTAEMIVRNARGVRSVHNEIAVRP
jgi:osmotically-inducible protein OsmY